MEKLDFEQMEMVEGGYVDKDISCGTLAVMAIGGIIFSETGFGLAIGTAAVTNWVTNECWHY